MSFEMTELTACVIGGVCFLLIAGWVWVGLSWQNDYIKKKDIKREGLEERCIASRAEAVKKNNIIRFIMESEKY